MTCIRPAGRRGACSCGNQYAQILDRLDTVEQEASDAKTTAQTAANTASIQAANAAADAAQAASDASDALTQAGNAAASAAAAALDAGNAAADLASINSTISSTLTTYLGTKVDKLTTTGSFAYTHTNATQGETALVDGTTSNTIPIRDGNGRMQAADPASGATDKTLVTANWISQTGSGKPNNVLHDTGNESKSGTMTFDDPVYGRFIYPLYEEYTGALPSGKYRIFARIPAANTNSMIVIDAMVSANGGNFGYGRMIIGNPNNTSWFCRWVLRKSGGFLSATSIQIAKEISTGDLVILALNPTYTGLSINLVYSKAGSSIHGAIRVNKVTSSADYALDGTDPDLTNITAGSDM